MKRQLGLTTCSIGFFEVDALNWCAIDCLILSEQITFADLVYLQFDYLIASK
jgi:hypothetical protein